MTLIPIRSTLRGAAALGLALMLSLPASAQDAGTPPATDAPADTAAPADAAPSAALPEPTAPGGTLSVGQALGGGPEIYVREEHGDWQIRCLEAPEGQEDPCQMYQRLSDQQGNPTADVNIFVLPDGGDLAAGATILTPLQTLLTAQVRMSVDGGQPRAYPFSFCDTTGCYSRMGFTAADVTMLQRGTAATLIVVPALAPDQQAEMTMSLDGFTAALAAVSATPAQ